MSYLFSRVAPVVALACLTTGAHASLALDSFNLTNSNFNFGMLGTITTPYDVTCHELWITSDTPGPWATEYLSASFTSSLTIGSATVSRVDVQSWDNYSRIVLVFNQGFVSGPQVSGSLNIAMPTGESFFGLATRDFQIAVTPGLQFGGGNYLFTNIPAQSVPAPGAIALIGLTGLCSRRRRSN